MRSRTRRNSLASVCLVCLAGCESGKSLESTASTTSTDSETSDEEWAECLPRSVSNSSFSVGPDEWSTGYDPIINWPPGHHHAVCVVDSTEVVAVPASQEMQVFIRLLECQDETAQPIAWSLDVSFASDVFIDPPPGIDVGREVRVSYSVKIWGPSVYQSWYSLRDAQTDELLLAAFSDPGPTVMPKVPDEPNLDNWLAPFTATLGPFGCAPELEVACEGDDTPQRAFVEFSRDGSTWDVLGGTEGDLGDYRVHLGFAGAPDACEGMFNNNVIEGILIQKD